VQPPADPVSVGDRVRAGFATIAAGDPQRYLVLAADQPIDAIAAAVLARVLADLAARGRS